MPKQDYDKIVKLACKPKNAPPKVKYLDALIAGTFDEHALQDITRSLAMRVRDGNPVVVFKALITIHKLMQAGSSEALLSHLGQNDNLRLRNVQVHSDGAYRVPANVTSYAYYLDSRIRAYRDLKHDLFALQTESNRRSTGLGANSKARRLRHLPVEKGLLREVKQVQRILDAMVRCTFYDDNLGDENTVLAFRMVIKDMLVLFQAGNEGVCNILEHYFEMSKVDATESFEIYKSFIKQTDKVVDFLAMARRLNNVVNVPVPNLKHAPTSLVKALEEYLNDPNFEQNRLEYKNSLKVVEGKNRGASPAPPASPSTAAAKPSSPAPAAAAAASSSSSGAQPAAQQKIQDFLDSIQTDQQTLFGGPASSTLPNSGNMPMNQFQMNQFGQMSGGMPGQMNTMPTGMGMGMGMAPGQFGTMPMQQQPLQMQMTGSNPFRQSMFPQATGSGFLGPQMTGFPGQQQQSQPFLQPQTTGGFLQPQTTGQMAFQAHRQSMFPAMGMGGGSSDGMEQLAPQQTLQPQPTGFLQRSNTLSNPFRQSSLGDMGGNAGGGLFHSQSPSPSGSMGLPSAPFHEPMRSSSTPIVSSNMTASPKALVPQKTGSNNPFAPPGGVPSPPPAVPKLPSMNELAQNRMNQQFGMGMGGGMGQQQQQQQQQQHPTTTAAQSQQTTSTAASWDPFAPTPKTNGSAPGATGGSSAMSDIASAFALDNKPAGGSDFASKFGSLTIGGSSPTATTSGIQPQATGFLQPQRTGFGGSSVKPFKPTSSFGSTLMETLPPIPEPSSTPGAGGAANGLGGSGAGTPFGNGHTGGGIGGSAPSSPFTANANSPFASAFGNSTSNAASNAASNANRSRSNSFAPPNLNPQPTGFQPTSSFGQNLVAANPAPLQPQTTGSNPFRASMMFGGGTGGGMGSGMGMGGMGMGAQATGAPGSGPFGVGSPFAQPQQQQKSTQASLLG